MNALEPLYAPWEEPNMHRVKDAGLVPGRCNNRATLLPYIRSQISDWRPSGKEGGSETTKTLLNHGFAGAHEDDFRHHYRLCQAVETLLGLVEFKRFLVPSGRVSPILPNDHPQDTAFTNASPDNDQWGLYCSKPATRAGKAKGVKRLCVNVFDVFGIDTTKVIEVRIG